MKKVFEFNSQANVGLKGELLFLESYPKAVKTDGLIDDFVLGGKTVELKTDTYSMSKTKNFFMEKYGNIKTKKLGGPWRTANDRVDFFVYLFIKEKTFFWFDPTKLVEFLEDYILDIPPSYIDNKTWAAEGYKVSRKDVEHLLIKTDTFNG